MTDGKHTPGPWTATPAKVCTDPRHETPCPLPCDACEEECGTEHEWSEEAKAQMLHDAAPALLEALHRLIFTSEIDPRDMAFARRVYAKATGKES